MHQVDSACNFLAKASSLEVQLQFSLDKGQGLELSKGLVQVEMRVCVRIRIKF